MHTLYGDDGHAYWCGCGHDGDHDETDRTCVCVNAQGDLVRRLAATCAHDCDHLRRRPTGPPTRGNSNSAN